MVFVNINNTPFGKCALRDVSLAVHGEVGIQLIDVYVEKRKRLLEPEWLEWLVSKER